MFECAYESMTLCLHCVCSTADCKLAVAGHVSVWYDD